jgi:hypothetical protein
MPRGANSWGLKNPGKKKRGFWRTHGLFSAKTRCLLTRAGQIRQNSSRAADRRERSHNIFNAIRYSGPLKPKADPDYHCVMSESARRPTHPTLRTTEEQG